MNKEELALEVIIEGFRKFMNQMDRMEHKIDDSGKAWKNTGGKASKAAGILKTIGAGALTAVAGAATLAVGAVTAVGGAIAVGVKTAIDYESAFAGVIKTVDGVVDAQGNLTATGEELKTNLRGLATEIPVAFQDLAGIAELGGQLGVAGDDIIKFTDTVAKIGVATNLTTEDAATSFAQFGNIMGSTQDDLDRWASSVVHLGNNMATTESSIVNFSQRIAGAGAIAGLSEADVAGVAAAFSSVGIEAEAGGTAVQKVLLGINTAVIENGDMLDTYAAITGRTAEEFAEAWETDAAGAFTDFVSGLGTAGDEAILLLQDLELGDQRLIRSFLSLAQSGDLLTDSIEMSNQAFADGTALNEEAERRFETTESQMQLLKNTFMEIFAVIGEAFLPVFNEMIGAFRDFLTEHGDSISAFFQNLSVWIGENIVPAIQTFVEWIGENLPVAMEAVSTFWNETLLPVFESLQKQFGETAPEAISVFTDLWENHLLPLVQQLGIFINETLLPVLSALWTFFVEQLVPILSVLIEEYLKIMIDMWTSFFTIINENVVPALITLWEWLSENVVPIIEELVTWFVDELLPALDEVWQFLDENFTPVFKALFDVIDELIRLGLEILVYWWKDEVMPALNDVWKLISEKVLPIFRDFNDFLVEKLFGELDQATTKFSNIEQALNFIKDAAKSVTEWLGNLATKLASISIPDQLKFQSPPKFARGLDFVSDSARHLATVELPKLEARFASMNHTVPQLSPVGSTTNNNIQSETNYNLTTQSVNQPGTLAMEFQSMELASR